MWEEQGRASSWSLEALPVWATCHVQALSHIHLALQALVALGGERLWVDGSGADLWIQGLTVSVIPQVLNGFFVFKA